MQRKDRVVMASVGGESQNGYSGHDRKIFRVVTHTRGLH